MKINIDNTVLSLVKFTVITIFSRFQKYKKISIRHVQRARLSSNNYVTIANIYIYLLTCLYCPTYSKIIWHNNLVTFIDTVKYDIENI